MTQETTSTTSRDPVLHIIAVHGVGAPERGSLLPGLMTAFASRQPEHATFISRRLAIGEHVYSGVETKDPTPGGEKVAIWDANWADIHRAPRGWLAQVPFLLRLLVSTVAYVGETSKLARLYHLFFACFLIWFAAVPALSLWSSVLPSNWLFAPMGLAISAGILVLAYTLRPIDVLAYRAGWVWAIGCAGLVVARCFFGPQYFHPDAIHPDALGPAARLIPAILGSVGPLLILVILGAGANGAPLRVHLSRVGLVALGSALLTAGMAAVLWANLFAAQRLINPEPGLGLVSQADFEGWSQGYACALPYQIASAEAFTATATATATVLVGLLFVGALILWGALTYLRPYPRSGAVLRGIVRVITAAIGPVYLIVFGLIALDMLDTLDLMRAPVAFEMARERMVLALPWIGSIPEEGSCRADVLEIYGASMLRLLPFVAMLALPPARIALDVMADIIHYLRDPQDPKERLGKLLETLGTQPNRIAVVAHSQGSRIAVDTIFGDSRFLAMKAKLATTGSPVETLYGVFLGRADLPASLGGWSWRNYWRGSDFVGGDISHQIEVSEPIASNFEHHHINYWIEEDVMTFLLKPEAALEGKPNES